MRAGGIMPELRADRLRTIAERVVREFGGGLEALMKRPLTEVRKALKSFPTIGDPGADRIILFTGKAPVAAVPANALDVPIRLGFGRAARSWGTSYRAAQRALDQTLPRTVPARRRAYLLFRRHAEEVCKRARPLCERCVVSAECEYFQRRGRS